jgi:hypothetical protein
VVCTAIRLIAGASLALLTSASSFAADLTVTTTGADRRQPRVYRAFVAATAAPATKEEAGATLKRNTPIMRCR